MIAIIEERLQSVTKDSTNAGQHLLDLSSDEYLDLVLAEGNRFKEIADKLKTLNELTIKEFNVNREETYHVLPLMRELYDKCMSNIGLLKDRHIDKGIPVVIEYFKEEAEQLKENIDDFELIKGLSPMGEEWEAMLK